MHEHAHKYTFKHPLPPVYKMPNHSLFCQEDDAAELWIS